MSWFISTFSHLFLGDIRETVKQLNSKLQIIEQELNIIPESDAKFPLIQNDTESLSTYLEELTKRLVIITSSVKDLRYQTLNMETYTEYVDDLKKEREKYLAEHDTLTTNLTELSHQLEKNKAQFQTYNRTIMDIIQLRDQIVMLQKSEDVNLSTYASELSTSISKILERSGVKILTASEGANFDNSCHKIIGAIPTDNPSENGKIKETLRDGYSCNGDILRYVDVEVYSTKTNNR